MRNRQIKPRLTGTSRHDARGRHTRNPGYLPGDNWLVCDICGCEVYSSKAKVRWDNMVVCPDDWEPRHEQDFVRARNDKIAAQGLVRPESQALFITNQAPAIILRRANHFNVLKTSAIVSVDSTLAAGTVYVALRTTGGYTGDDAQEIKNTAVDSQGAIFGTSSFEVTTLLHTTLYYYGFVQETSPSVFSNVVGNSFDTLQAVIMQCNGEDAQCGEPFALAGNSDGD